MSTKRKSKHGDLRDACVNEALAIIGESGLEALSLREVARRLKVSHQAPYKHFPSRDHILAAVVSRAYAAFGEYLDARLRSTDAMEDLGNMGKCYLDYAQANPLHYRLMFETQLPDPKLHPEMMQHAQHAFSILREAITRLPGSHESEAEPPELDALFVWAAMHGMASIMRSHAIQTLNLPREILQMALPFGLHKVSIALSSGATDSVIRNAALPPDRVAPPSSPATLRRTSRSSPKP